MPSFPQMKDLPPVLDSTGWTWAPYEAPFCSSIDLWLGSDRKGDKWLIKPRGSFYAYREIVFARLAQKMGWSCQSSAFLRLDKQSAKALGVPTAEIHAAHWFMEEHVHNPCSAECQLTFLFGRSINTVDDLQGFEIEHLLDWPKSELAACLFGANERPDRLYTTSHEFVIIDSEQMFSTDPCSLYESSWCTTPEGHPSPSGRTLAYEVCLALCSLSSADIGDALFIPKGVSVKETWPIAAKLKASRKFAADFCALYDEFRT